MLLHAIKPIIRDNRFVEYCTKDMEATKTLWMLSKLFRFHGKTQVLDLDCEWLDTFATKELEVSDYCYSNNGSSAGHVSMVGRPMKQLYLED